MQRISYNLLNFVIILRYSINEKFCPLSLPHRRSETAAEAAGSRSPSGEPFTGPRAEEGNAMEHFVTFMDVSKFYQTGDVRIAAADKMNFYIDKGEFCIIVGPSGAGKTTLLNMLGGMDTCDEGTITLDGEVVSNYTAKQLTEYRRYDVGFVFQFYNLVQNLTALENVELASEICRDPLDAAKTLQEVGLGERLQNFPAQLSGGEQQRVSIARALAKNPKLLLCDEPTGALDYKTGKAVLGLLQDTCRQTGRTVVVITHNTAITAMADRIIQVKSGRILSNEVNEHPIPVEQIEW